jgi:tetratricopeptide (TPR) repeat protein
VATSFNYQPIRELFKFAGMKSTLLKCFPFILIVLISISCKNNGSSTADNNDILTLNATLKSLTEKIKKNPDEANLYYERGIELRRVEMDSMALDDFKKAVNLDSNKAEYYSAIGDLMFEHKDISGSIAWFKQALKLNPKDPRAHLKMAKMFLYIKDYTSAFEEINTVLRQDVYNPEGYFLKGKIYAELKDTSKAISSYQTAVQVDPEYREAMVHLGQLYLAKRDMLGMKYLDNAYKLDTNDMFPLFAKGVYYQNNNNYEQAKTVYRDIVLKDRQYSDAYSNMGYIYIQQDSFDKAWRQYDLVIKMEPASAEGYYSRGLSSELMGKKEDAIADYRQALVFDEKYQEPKEGLKRLGAQ